MTLAEAFWFGKDLCSCYDIYRWYLTLELWIHKCDHPSSTNEAGMVRKAGKELRFRGIGKWGLPAPGQNWW